MLKEFDRAQADYQQALRLDPRNGQIYYNQGVLYQKMGHPMLSRKDFEKAKALGYRP